MQVTTMAFAEQGPRRKSQHRNDRFTFPRGARTTASGRIRSVWVDWL